MVKSIEFRDTKEYSWYPQRLPCLKGKKFEFQPGINIICGYNGCGKSSMLRCIRRMTFCDKQVHSKLQTSDFTWAKVHTVVEELYGSVDLINDWNKSVFSLRPAEEVTGENFCDDTSTFSQMMSSGSYSAGMNTLSAIAYLLERLHKSRKGGEEADIRDFNKQVMEIRLSFRSDTTLANASEKLPAYCVKKYMSEHQLDSEGVTVIMDEPDRSIDILTADQIYGILDPDRPGDFKNSFLVVFHNTDMINRFLHSKNKSRINWIELTPGYLENVVRFHNGEKLIRPEKSWWIANH